jgi:UDP-N-acetylglucosamine 2-epimerase
MAAKLAERQSKILDHLDLEPQSYALATVHRAENTDGPARLVPISSALGQLANSGFEVVFPMHPRTRKKIKSFDISLKNPKVINPVSYLDMLKLEQKAAIILTDSGGVQKEAYWFGVPCLTWRDDTEWIETVESGWNTLVGCNPQQIVSSFKSVLKGKRPAPPVDEPAAAAQIVKIFSAAALGIKK